MEDKKYFNIPEILVLWIQHVKWDPFIKLMRICKPITMSLTNKYYFKDYETDDVLQEARKILVKAIKQYNFDGEMCFLQFYHMCLSNHFNMMVRKECAHKRKINTETYSLDELVEEAGEYIQGTSSVMKNPESALLVKEVYENYILELSPFEKEVFGMQINGISLEQAAVVLECTETKIKNAWYRCVMKFKNAIE